LSVKGKIIVEINLNVPQLGIDVDRELSIHEAREVYTNILSFTKDLERVLDSFKYIRRREILPAKPQLSTENLKRILEIIEESVNGVYSKELAARIGIHKSSINKALKWLHEKGEIERKKVGKNFLYFPLKAPTKEEGSKVMVSTEASNFEKLKRRFIEAERQKISD